MDISDTPRQIFAVIDLLATLVICAAWWFAFVRVRRAVVFLTLALIQTFVLIMSVYNVHFAFTERFLIPFSSAKAEMAFFMVVSYVQASMWVLQAVASVFLVRWIVRNCQKTP
jgi:hypothetical protein